MINGRDIHCGLQLRQGGGESTNVSFCGNSTYILYEAPLDLEKQIAESDPQLSSIRPPPLFKERQGRPHPTPQDPHQWRRMWGLSGRLTGLFSFLMTGRIDFKAIRNTPSLFFKLETRQNIIFAGAISKNRPTLSPARRSHRHGP